MASDKAAAKQTQRDPELLALHRMNRELEPLPIAAKFRILKYLLSRTEQEEKEANDLDASCGPIPGQDLS